MKKVTLISTGGTIASSRDEGSGTVTAGLSGDLLLSRLHEPLDNIAVTVENFETAGSYALDLSTVYDLCRRIDDVLADPTVSGVVITHGTDTMEESAFLAWLLVKSDKPVVFTGAQRHSDMPDTDGPRNIHDAICAAATSELHGYGAVVLFEGDIHGARYVTKAHTSRVNTFQSIGHGKLGEVDQRIVHLYSRPFGRRNVLEVPKLCTDIELISLGLGAAPKLMRLSAENGAKGIVLEAFGRGNAPKGFAAETAFALGKGCPVVLASRCREGRVSPIYGNDSGGVTLHEQGAILAGDLSAIKARLLLSVLIGGEATLPEIELGFLTIG